MSLHDLTSLTRALTCSSANKANSHYNWKLNSQALVIHCQQCFEVAKSFGGQLITVRNVLALIPILF